MKKVTISVRMFPDEKEELSKLAEKEDQSLDRLVRFMIRESLQLKRKETTKMEAATV
jgi:predicted transcriptional regulator